MQDTPPTKMKVIAWRRLMECTGGWAAASKIDDHLDTALNDAYAEAHQLYAHDKITNKRSSKGMCHWWMHCRDHVIVDGLTGHKVQLYWGTNNTYIGALKNAHKAALTRQSTNTAAAATTTTTADRAEVRNAKRARVDMVEKLSNAVGAMGQHALLQSE